MGVALTTKHVVNSCLGIVVNRNKIVVEIWIKAKFHGWLEEAQPNKTLDILIRYSYFIILVAELEHFEEKRQLLKLKPTECIDWLLTEVTALQWGITPFIQFAFRPEVILKCNTRCWIYTEVTQGSNRSWASLVVLVGKVLRRLPEIRCIPPYHALMTWLEFSTLDAHTAIGRFKYKIAHRRKLHLKL